MYIDPWRAWGPPCTLRGPAGGPRTSLDLPWHTRRVSADPLAPGHHHFSGSRRLPSPSRAQDPKKPLRHSATAPGMPTRQPRWRLPSTTRSAGSLRMCHEMSRGVQGAFRGPMGPAGRPPGPLPIYVHDLHNFQSHQKKSIIIHVDSIAQIHEFNHMPQDWHRPVEQCPTEDC